MRLLAALTAMGLAAAVIAPPQAGSAAPGQASSQGRHLHGHTIGPAGTTYDLRWLDGMVQHHIGALRMSEYVFGIGHGGVGALGKRIWDGQNQEIRAMQLWRKAWYPDAPTYPVSPVPGGDPNSATGLQRMGIDEIKEMQMLASPPKQGQQVTWFLEGMLNHHGAALVMAHDCLRNSTNTTLRRLARDIILAQRAEILEIRRMLLSGGLDSPEYYRYDKLFSFHQGPPALDEWNSIQAETGEVKEPQQHLHHQHK